MQPGKRPHLIEHEIMQLFSYYFPRNTTTIWCNRWCGYVLYFCECGYTRNFPSGIVCTRNFPSSIPQSSIINLLVFTWAFIFILVKADYSLDIFRSCYFSLLDFKLSIQYVPKVPNTHQLLFHLPELYYLGLKILFFILANADYYSLFWQMRFIILYFGKYGLREWK